MGDIDVGIAAVEWAPDQELLVVINCEGSLLVMTREFDVLSETPLETDEFGVETPINVGWGKRETQFQGKVPLSVGSFCCDVGCPACFLTRRNVAGRESINSRGSTKRGRPSR